MNGEALVRVEIFLAVAAAMALWEILAPRRGDDPDRLVRWTNNLGILVLDAVAVRLVAPASAVGVALAAEVWSLGLFNATDWPAWLEFVLAVLVLDLAIYAQHVAFHHIPVLWRLHRMHHADTVIDVTTGGRFHPIEILLSLGIKAAVIIALGASPGAVLTFEVLLNATSMFNHANIRMPARLDAILRWIVVTPDMHRVHHSTDRPETDSNFGFNLPWWDRLFGTYRAQPKAGHDGMTLGLPIFRERRERWLDRLLTQPFRSGER
ncbi:sterol desaturase family protein [Chelatococcus sp. SYSU_G07232]|uniref:Sterol desaturase family protein n=1 Tax=Chelatococcus albus TaxID=3047466 RepID=A0ABT7ALD2_9HYPH|nr:sterol desaturase family protein [Chelatococcus sp. SYSU_G07232]MDJ1160185.1 sterol desaturase family protein [Chelatococcus sp. SYSU_G07232]